MDLSDFWKPHWWRRWEEIKGRASVPWDKHKAPAKFECPGCGRYLETSHNNPLWLESLERAKSVSRHQARAEMKRTGRCPICDRQASKRRDEWEDAAPARPARRRVRAETSAGEILGLKPFVWVIIGVGAGCVLLFGVLLVVIAASSSRPVAVSPAGPNTPPDNLPPAPPAHEPPSASKMPGLLAYWSFDEGAGDNAVDGSGRAVRAKLINVGWASGMRGKALSFNGAGSYFDYGDSPSFSFAAGTPFTCSLWVQTRSSRATVLSQRNSRDGSPVVDILISNGRLSAQVRRDGNEFDSPVQIDSRIMNDGQWHHLALVRDGDALELFLDSISQGQKRGAAAGGPITTDLRAIGSERYWISRKVAHGDPHFQGSIDEFCIFDRALKADEIATLAGR